MAFTLPELPYKLEALKPFLSEEQLTFHYTKHHAAYINNLNNLTEGKPEAGMSLRDLIQKASGGVYNNAAQAWNHTFFWNSMSPSGGGKPAGKLLSAIERDFGGFDAFKEQFTNASKTLFGSGWGWLAADAAGKLTILALSNADNPLKQGKEPLLTIDVWEHAYYIDYRNDRPKYVNTYWDFANWKEAAQIYEKLAK